MCHVSGYIFVNSMLTHGMGSQLMHHHNALVLSVWLCAAERLDEPYLFSV
jgi:hypothetical protein